MEYTGQQPNFYAVNLKPYSNGTTRWLVYEMKTDECASPYLTKLWPMDSSNPKKAKQNGFTYTTNRKWPAYHIYINEIGTSHTYLLKEQVCFILKNERGIDIDPNNLKLEVLS